MTLWVPALTYGFVHAKQRLLDQNNKSPWVHALNCGFWSQNNVFWYRIISLYVSQTSPVALCMQIIVISTRITSICWTQPLSVVFACKTATFGPESQVSMCTRPHLSFCAWKTAWLAPEILVFMGPSPHLWFLNAKQQLLNQNNISLWVPDITCCFVNVKQRV